MSIPAITWGTSFANTLNIGYPLDGAVSWSEPREGSETIQTAAGAEDAWDEGTDYYLAGELRWIPTSNSTSPVTATGWDGSTGVRAFLEWARKKNAFRWIPDKDTPGTYVTSYLVEPYRGEPALEEADGTRRLRIVMRNASSSYDGY